MYANVEPITIMKHLWINYSTAEADDLEANDKRMKTPWCPPDTIETLFEQLVVSQPYAVDAGGETWANTTIVKWGHENIKNTGLFDSHEKDGKKKHKTTKHGKLSRHITRTEGVFLQRRSL